ncbi:hypothetical protein MTO96_027192 [Rhipicephalus appendiculatus]
MANALFLHNQPPWLSLACHEALLENNIVKGETVESHHCSGSSTTAETSSLLRQAPLSKQLAKEEAQPAKPVNSPTPKGNINATVHTPASNPKFTPSAPAQHSENSDSNSDSSEDEAPQRKTTPAAPPKQEAVQSKVPGKRVKPETNSFDSSDSEAVAPPSEKPAVPTPVLMAAAKEPQQSKKPQDSSSDHPSDNDASKPPPAKKRATVKTAPKAQNAASSAKKAAAKRDESSISEPQETMAVRPRSAATPPVVAPKATPAKPQKDDSDSSAESEDDQPPKKVAKPEAASAKKTLKIVNRKPPVTFVIRQVYHYEVRLEVIADVARRYSLHNSSLTVTLGPKVQLHVPLVVDADPPEHSSQRRGDFGEVLADFKLHPPAVRSYVQLATTLEPLNALSEVTVASTRGGTTTAAYSRWSTLYT